MGIEYQIDEEKYLISIHGDAQQIRELALAIAGIINPHEQNIFGLDEELESPSGQFSSFDGNQRMSLSPGRLDYYLNVRGPLREDLLPTYRSLYFNQIAELVRAAGEEEQES